MHEGLCWFSPRDTFLDLAGHNQTANLDAGRLDGWAVGLNGWACPKRHEWPKVTSTNGCELPKGVSNQGLRTPSGTSTKGYEDQEVPKAEGVRVPSGKYTVRLGQGKSRKVRSAIGLTGLGVRLTRPLDPGPRLDQVRKSVGPLSRTSSRPVAPRFYPNGRIGLQDDPDCSCELRMVLVKPRSREGSVSERLCNVWVDDARDELVIVYETVKKLCIRSHVSK
ncbi:hypothetical protein IGI04_022867 [Brassica rapa subsp. trilocularis]|uniref:Uncharacterized protein n=1 Tax=Brassica rapa subsp. trilocularis TaxID=1813537 RepID=A0ABQ7M290_BRACM|nr:hypothetical protein IGI04_022867 [Brassica rapa subsp. trilocularis]